MQKSGYLCVRFSPKISAVAKTEEKKFFEDIVIVQQKGREAKSISKERLSIGQGSKV